MHDTIARIISAIEPSQFQDSFINLMKEAELSTQGEIIAVDGKKVRRSYDKKGKQGAIHMVSVFAAENGVVLGQVKTYEKSNEITAIPDLLSKLDIKGAVVIIKEWEKRKGWLYICLVLIRFPYSISHSLFVYITFLYQGFIELFLPIFYF